MPSAAFLIYSGTMPLIKTLLSILIGFVLARMELFPTASSRGASHVTMNVALPLLIFSSIVPAFTPQNVSAIGPMLLLAFIYQAIGFLFGVMIREFFYIPRNFWQGILIVCGLSNWGNLPNAIVLSVTAQPPFDPTTDPALGVSFVSIFIVAYHLTFFVGGAAHSLSWDYLPGIPQGEAAELHLTWKQKPLGSLFARYVLKETIPPVSPAGKHVLAVEAVVAHMDKEKAVEDSPSGSTVRLDANQGSSQELGRTSSHMSIANGQVSMNHTTDILQATLEPHDLSPAVSRHEDSGKLSFLPLPVQRILRSLSKIVTPVTISLAVSLPIALIQPLKALFVEVPSPGPNFTGPDGRPPLAFLIDTADFVGIMTVPLALILLGASFARLSLPRPFSRLPIMAMLAVTIAKMVILPIIGVLVVQAMIKGGLINHNSKVEKLVAMILSGSPSAVNQLIVASLYSPDGNVDILAAFLLVQYIFMFFSSSALTAVSLLLS